MSGKLAGVPEEQEEERVALPARRPRQPGVVRRLRQERAAAQAGVADAEMPVERKDRR